MTNLRKCFHPFTVVSWCGNLNPFFGTGYLSISGSVESEIPTQLGGLSELGM
jgi:hypothetical protein